MRGITAQGTILVTQSCLSGLSRLWRAVLID